MKTYTVIGLYLDDYTRFASSYEARNPWEAEELAQEECEGRLVVAGVVEGVVYVVA